MTAEEFSTNVRIWAARMREQEIRNLMAFLGCNRERAEKLRVWLHNDEVVIGGLHRTNRAGQKFGERLSAAFSEAFGPLLRRYRS